MRTCKQCGGGLPTKVKVNGVVKHFGGSRKLCLQCSPFGNHNVRVIVEGAARCGRCGKSNGRGGTVCPSCRVILWRQRKKLRAVEYLGGKCYACGYSKFISALEFHHVDPAEKDTSLVGKTISWERMRQELDKCVILCSNCHRALHNGELHVDLPERLGTGPALPGKQCLSSRPKCLGCGRSHQGCGEVCKKCLSAKVQTKVLALQAEGRRVGEIAQVLGLSVASVSFRLRPGVHNRTRKPPPV